MEGIWWEPRPYQRSKHEWYLNWVLMRRNETERCAWDEELGGVYECDSGFYVAWLIAGGEEKLLHDGNIKECARALVKAVNDPTITHT